jgi:hypothetical protein
MIDKRAELRTVAIYAAAADRRRRDALDALRKDRVASGTEDVGRAIGEASLAVVALYLASSAAKRYCAETGEPGPLGRTELGNLVDQTTAMRDAVMHWDEKGQRDPQTSLFVDGRGVATKAPPRRSNVSIPAGVPWAAFARCAVALHSWAAFLLDPERVVETDRATGPDG